MWRFWLTRVSRIAGDVDEARKNHDRCQTEQGDGENPRDSRAWMQ